MVEVKHLKKTFLLGATKAKICPLEDVNFIVGENEIVSIVGKSGEGKSTIARLLCGAIAPDSGEVVYNGEQLFDKKNRYNRKAGQKIQLVPQQPFASLDPTQRVGDCIKEVLLYHKKSKNGKEAKLMAQTLLEKVWLDESVYDRLPHQISGGQAQRIAIARALAMEPQLIVADESTSMLDIPSQAQIVTIFKQLVADTNVSILFIAHDKNLVEAFADRSYRLTEGKLVEENEQRC